MPKTAKELLILNLDDSSDEEEVESKIGKYDLKEQWQSFKQSEYYKKSEAAGLSEEHMHYVFVAHAKGLRFLYAKEVNQIYYQQYKSIFLSDKKIPGDIGQWLENAITSAIRAFIETQSKKFLRHEEAIVEGFSSCLIKSLEEDIHTIATEFSENRLLLRYFRDPRDKSLRESLLELFKGFQGKLIDEFMKLVSSAVKKKEVTYKLANPDNVDATETSSIVSQFSKDEDEHEQQEIYETATECLKELEYPLRLRQGDEEYEEYEEYYVPSQNEKPTETKVNNYPYEQVRKGKSKYLAKAAVQIIQQASATGGDGHNIDNCWVRNWEELTRAYLKDMIKADEAELEAKTKSLQTTAWRLSKNHPYLRPLLRGTTFRLKMDSPVVFEKALIDQFKNSPPCVKSYQRPVLSADFSFRPKGPVEFFAYLRLSNRSQTRFIMNVFNNDFMRGLKQEKPAKFLSEIAHTWKFSQRGSVVFEKKGIRAAELAREDVVLGVDNYEAVCGTIKAISDYCNGHDPTQQQEQEMDANIAGWIRDIFLGAEPAICNEQGKKLEGFDYQYICEKLSTITYLLLGCEVVRNPASLVLNQMMLDLIIWKKITWSQALDRSQKGGPIMPMAPTGSTGAARSLEYTLCTFMPHIYQYQGPDKASAVVELMRREAALIEKWISFARENSKQELDDLIKRESEKWFGQSFELPSFKPALKVSSGDEEEGDGVSRSMGSLGV